MSFQMKIHFFPTEQKKNRYLGSGWVSSGGLKARFTVWENTKFSKGFSISFPSRKDQNDQIQNEVDFFNREASDIAYNEIEGHLKAKGLIGGGSSNGQYSNPAGYTPSYGQSQQSNSQSVPKTIQANNQVNPGAGVPKGVPF